MGHGSMRIKEPKPRVRYAPPVMGKLKGRDVVMCPFCSPPHPLSNTEPSQCGTMLDVRAVQAVFHNQRCALCGKTDGVQIMAGNKYIHDHDCTPGKRIFAVPPRKSFTASIVWRFPDFAQLWLARKFGKVILELKDANNKVQGYSWQKVNIHAATQVAVSGRSSTGIGQGISEP